MADENGRADSDSEAYLRKIAELLDLPIKEFFDPAGSRPADLDILHLWHALRSEDDRERALAYLRALVAGQDDRDGR